MPGHEGKTLLAPSGAVFVREDQGGAAILSPARPGDCACCADCLWMPERGLYVYEWPGGAMTAMPQGSAMVSSDPRHPGYATDTVGAISAATERRGAWIMELHGAQASRARLRVASINDFGGRRAEHAVFWVSGASTRLHPSTRQDDTITELVFENGRGEARSDAGSSQGYGKLFDAAGRSFQADIVIAGEGIDRIEITQYGQAGGIIWMVAFCGARPV